MIKPLVWITSSTQMHRPDITKRAETSVVYALNHTSQDDLGHTHSNPV